MRASDVSESGKTWEASSYIFFVLVWKLIFVDMAFWSILLPCEWVTIFLVDWDKVWVFLV